MLMVIVLHTKTYGLMGVSLNPTEGIYWVVWILYFLSIVAVNCFVLISGYFTSTSTSPFSLKKLLKLWLQVEFFSVGTYLIMCTIPNSGVEFGFGQFLVQLFPILSNQYWFFTCYLVLIILAPFLNKFINTMEQKEFKRCILILLALFVLIPSFNIFGDSFDTSKGYSITWFIVLYLVAAYLRRYPLPKKPYGVFYIVISLLSLLNHTLLDKLNDYLLLFGQARDILIRYNSLSVFAASVCLFLFFIQHPLKTEKASGKIISRISAASFSVYLLHEHPVIRNILWQNIVRLEDTTSHLGLYFSRLAISVAVIFVVGVIAGLLLTTIISAGEKIITKIAKNKGT